jgi:hypothetical protein
MLEVIEHQQELPLAEGVAKTIEHRPRATFTNIKRSRNDRRHERGITDWRQWDKNDAIREGINQKSGDCERQLGLADATRSSEGEQPHIVTLQERAGRVDLCLAADKARDRPRQIGLARDTRREWCELAQGLLGCDLTRHVLVLPWARLTIVVPMSLSILGRGMSKTIVRSLR